MFSKEELLKLQEFQNQIADKKVYSYDESDENKYSSETNVQLNQMASLRKNKAIYYIGANCTEKKPPKTKEGEIALFNKTTGEWEAVEDAKGKEYYDIEKSSIEEIKTHRDDGKHIFLSEKDKEEIFTGKSIKVEDGKYVFYWSDKQLTDKTIKEALSFLEKTDFYFYNDYPKEKVPAKMSEYREYLRSLNSEHNLSGKKVQTLTVLTFEEFCDK